MKEINMKRKTTLLYVFGLALLFLSTACTIHIPYDFDMTGEDCQIMFQVTPEDAKILLNGKLIGEAYEFASWKSALRLSTKSNEVIVKREGYIEEVVDLHAYNGRKFTVQLNLKRDKFAKPVKKIIRKRELIKKDPKGHSSQGVSVKPKDLDTPDTETGIKIKKAIIAMNISPAESAIYLDKKFWGITPPSGKIQNMVLKKGSHTIEVLKPGYRSYRRTLQITGTEQELHLNIKLIKK